jgi:ribonuclease P protein component
VIVTDRSARFRNSNRLNKPSEYTSVFANGERTHSSQLLCLSLANGLLRPRLGLAISKKHIPKATRRNKLKRLLRECFRQYKDKLSGMDIVVTSKKNIGNVETRHIIKLFEKSLNKNRQ